MAKKNVTRIGQFKFGKNLKNFQKEKDKIAVTIGRTAVTHFRRGFRTGGGQTNFGRWKPRQQWIPGKGQGRNILVKTGHLRDSISIIRANFKSIIVGTKGIPYAKIHNDGGKIKQIVTAKQRAFFFATAKGLGKKGAIAKDMFTAAALSEELNIEIPKREFIGDSRKLNRKIVLVIKKRMKKVFI